MIGLVDCNNFYVSCERIFDPTLEGKPVAVLSNNDGSAISRSEEFKAFNINKKKAFYQIREFGEKNGFVFKSSNYELYGDISNRVIETLHKFTPNVEQYSIDEAFIHIDLPAGGDYFLYGKEIRETILQWVGMPCGVGFAKSKTLAKIANHIGKKEPSGVFVMPDNPQNVLENLPVIEVWGVAYQLSKKLAYLGIKSAWQLAQADEVYIKKIFGVNLTQTVLELRGNSVINIEDFDRMSKRISCSRIFGRMVIELADLREAISHYIALAAVKLRKEKQRTAGIIVYFEINPEYTPIALAGGNTSKAIVFPYTTNDTSQIISFTLPHLKDIFIKNRRYKKAGIIFFGLEEIGSQQLNLFLDNKKIEPNSQLYEAVDKINYNFGKGTVFNLAEGIKKSWQMKQEFLSPKYTTNWKQILKVK